MGYKLDLAQRREAGNLEEWVIENPLDAAYEIVALRGACEELEELVEKWRNEADDWLEDETTLWPFELRKALADRFLRHADQLEAVLSRLKAVR
jgi:hypothetical protein